MSANKKAKCDGQLASLFGGCLYFSLGRLYRTIERLAFEAFRPLALAPTQAFMMMAVFELGDSGASPTDLSNTMNLDRSTVTRLLFNLEKKHLIKSTTKGRFKKIHLTSRGREMVPQIKNAWQELYKLYSKELGDQKADTISAFMRKQSSY